MRLTSTGLGIGTSSPAYKLDVSGQIRAQVGVATASYQNGIRLSDESTTTIALGLQNIAGSSLPFIYGNTAIGFGTNLAERMRLDSSGNLGLGVTPSAWSATARAIQVGIYSGFYQNASGLPEISFNSFQNASNVDTYRVSANTAGKYQVTEAHKWFTAPSGTAGDAISFTQAMTLDASGNLLVGETARAYLSRFTLSYDPASTNGPIFLDTRSFAINRGAFLWLGGKYNTGGAYRPYGGVGALKENGTDGDSAGYLSFQTNGNAADSTERARITSGGDLLVGTTSGTGKTVITQSENLPVLSLNNTNTSFTDGALILYNTRATTNSTYNHFACYNGDFTGQFIVRDSGDAVNTNNSYGAISDVKLKENVVDASPKLDKLNQVRVVNYNLKDQPDQKLLGVIAQELEQVFPGMVEEAVDRDAEGNDLGTTTKSVKYSVFVPMLIKALQEATTEINSLKARLDAANL
jgi:hypothetical protein